jgi:hypothetical protein
MLVGREERPVAVFCGFSGVGEYSLLQGWAGAVSIVGREFAGRDRIAFVLGDNSCPAPV